MKQISSRRLRGAAAIIGLTGLVAMLAACGPQVTTTTTEQTTTRQVVPTTVPVTSTTVTTTQRTTP